MTNSGYSMQTLKDISAFGNLIPIRHTLGISSFGINAWQASEAGEQLVPDHQEEDTQHEEVYLVLSGRATFTVAGDVLDAPTGTLVCVNDPIVQRSATAAEADTTVLAVGGRPAHAYNPVGWELNHEITPLFESGDFASAKDKTRAALGQYPDSKFFLYNLACAEAQLGEIDAAIDDLTRVLEPHPEFKQMAAADDDLAPLREHLRFQALVAGGG
jgi:tetratricopeptide (TPR) repeat protein